MSSFQSPQARTSPALARALERLDALVDWERRERAPAGTPAMKVTIDPVRDLLRRLAVRPGELRAVHVAGTKGKGSVCALVEAGLGAAGLFVGRYASPHVERVTERISLGGAPIDEEPLAELLEEALDARRAALAEGSPGTDATWFDVLTAAALAAFQRTGVDLAVVECGLGGRLDSTNVLEAEVCVLTNVELEHTAILGATRAAIAAEKGAIAGPGATLICGLEPGGEAGRVLASLAVERGFEPRWLPPPPGAPLSERNRLLAAAALDELGRRGLRGRGAQTGGAAPISGALLGPAELERARLPARLERRQYLGVPVVLDGAHVAASLAEVLTELEAEPGLVGRPVSVLGLGGDKDAGAILKVLGERVDRLLCTSVGVGPYLESESLARLARQAGIEAEGLEDPRRALARAAELARGGGWVLVVGSLHLAGALRPLLTDGPEVQPCSRSSRTSS